ncbi:hypothetical protein COW36_14300 [bacterium (Candidatus Blackallbacteria) CG17_big_fil_post_rev_8_21_14_2_50_48_46]|uniref:Uncharacterized protein n=1 Tax=bacterium (Candidatus Blackallbacteria) CG17_big_fil_post_rev_8_21_14_2_50_48_46 TaxID=2014261 RepID=A0A2M7G2U7_9BACT|nr:MAG: hypothetical protein COW64_08825 [bacterium (Candidatus Blackallbacteria) CG18_big_fil_WC_8_21_14_2_50_49_26]PIW16132.1 MAG: hypothetical protein COW36_14300 [bacterium (Candidatus Blackallbacteria) CG17_big_fil_post_rev_8_21_14_2_50_48_46]PIW44219.1 MAG: hypothetical protein COW20_24630 [bacterium (Candidatus Blackallbacteria) CG13_big_fil_rev_8_21_14_2_50_49_14]
MQPLRPSQAHSAPFLAQKQAAPSAQPAQTAPTAAAGSQTSNPSLQTPRQGKALAVQSLVDIPADFPIWNFKAKSFPGFYPAGQDRSSAYHFAEIQKDLPAIWQRPWSQDLPQAKTHSGETYGQLFKRIGAEIGADPYALAAYCIFESYHSGKHSFNPRMQEIGKGMHAAGLAATQAQDWKGRQIPGLEKRFPTSTQATASLLRNHPEYSLRCLAAEFKQTYQRKADLAKTFPGVAYPAWGKPSISRGNYGTQAQYVSRAHVLYQGFRAADQAR